MYESEGYDDYGDDGAAAEEAAYQEMCEAGVFEEQQQMEAEGEAAAQEIHDCIEREKILMEEKRERRCKQCHCHGTNENQTSNDS